MIVLIGYIELYIEEAKSLKDRRSVVNSIISSLRNRFNISVSDIMVEDDFHYAKIGISAVTIKRILSNKMKESIINFIESNYPGRICDYLFETEDYSSDNV